MADKEEKILPVKERDDGSVIAAIEPEHELLLDEENTEDAAVDKEDQHASGDDTDDGGDADGDDADSGESEEERERIREARREERKLKKELAKQREVSAKHKISSLERRNEELAKRLVALENGAVSLRFAQVDKAVEDEATRVEYAKMKLLQASHENDPNAQVEYLEQLQDAKTRLAQLQAYKQQQIEEAKRPKQNVPNPVTTEVQANASQWLGKNKWFDPQARDTDSKIAKLVDQELAGEGWDPSDSEYWDELDNRLQSRLPHRYATRSDGKANVRRGGPTASARTANVAAKSANTITISKERVQAIKDAGAWDDPSRRAKMIKAYAAYDRQNRT